MEEDKQTITFFSDEVPQILQQQLNGELRPLWGSMNLQQMLTHLDAGLQLSMLDEERQIAIPEEKIERYKAFLRSDKPFPRSSPKPEDYKRYEQASGDWQDARNALLERLTAWAGFQRERPGFTSVHPAFGRLDHAHWRHLHRKHFRHHFAQFGLIDNYSG